jgi:hypothetical protein
MTSIKQALLNTKVRDLPKDFHVTIEVDDYEVMVITERQLSVTINKKRGPGRDTHVVVYDPDAELTVMEIYKKARALIEELVNKK